MASASVASQLSHWHSDTSIIALSSNIFGTTFEWGSGDTTDVISVTPNTTTNYYVTATSPNGCNSETEIEIIVNPLPIITISADNQYICEGDTSIITINSDIAETTFLWNNSSIADSIIVSPNTTTTYSVTATSPYSCVSKTEIEINVNSLPILTIFADNYEICQGDTAIIGVSSDIASTTFEWSNGKTTNNIFVSPDTTTT